jgi:YgiT-type zinc finger domain-containing protein
MKKRATGYDYRGCKICNTLIQEKLIKRDSWIRGKLIVVEDVPTGVCPKCGEKVVKVGVDRWSLRRIDNSEGSSKAPRISVLPWVTLSSNHLLECQVSVF